MPEPIPTAEQRDQATLAHHELAELVNRMAREGFTPAILLTGLAACAADLVTCTVGIDQVPRWFAGQAIATDTMLRDAG